MDLSKPQGTICCARPCSRCMAWDHAGNQEPLQITADWRGMADRREQKRGSDLGGARIHLQMKLWKLLVRFILVIQ